MTAPAAAPIPEGATSIGEIGHEAPPGGATPISWLEWRLGAKFFHACDLTDELRSDSRLLFRMRRSGDRR